MIPAYRDALLRGFPPGTPAGVAHRGAKTESMKPVCDPTGRTLVTRAEIVEGLRRLGVRLGDIIQVHSSLSALGYVEEGAEGVVDALLEAVGPSGTVMVPTFNHGRAEVYDWRTTPSVNGAVTEALRRLPEAMRSVHPTHPYSAIGPRAEYLVQGHLEVETFDRLSPLGKLADLGGAVVLLGVGMRANTAAHIGETIARVPCLGFGEYPRKILNDAGEVVPATSVVWRDGPCLIEWDPLEARMRSAGMIRDGRIGDGEVHWMRAIDVVEVTLQMTGEFCPGCPSRPRYPTSPV
jgi:aminoglycoside 3-N-acetyltransferase